MGAETRLTSGEGLERDPLLEQFWDKGLVLLGDRVREEYALHTPIFIDLRHKLYDDLNVLSSLGQALHRKLVSIVDAEAAPSFRTRLPRDLLAGASGGAVCQRVY